MFRLAMFSFLLLTLAQFVLGQRVKETRQEATVPSDNAQLLEQGQAAKLTKTTDQLKEIAVVSYNIRWRTGADLDQIAGWLKAKGGSVIALQEVDRTKARTAKSNNARALAESLGMHYAWAAPPSPKMSPKGEKNREEETGVELLSPYPLSEVTRIVLPHEGPGGRWRVALGATVTIGKTVLRVYSVHSETRISVDDKIEQYQAVLEDLARYPKQMPAVVMGDFNSWEPATGQGVRKLFTEAKFVTPFPDGETTFNRNAVLFDVKLKLDWIWLRGLTAKNYGIDRSLTVSDHFPLWTVVSEGSAASAQK